MTFAFADTTPVEQLSALFNVAFSDYVVPMALTPAVMEMKLARDGTCLDLSPLALHEGAPVGFILQSLGEWQGILTAYNGGTGVVPEARGQALTRQLYHFVLPQLRARGVKQCLLEVIQENTRALTVYQHLGFAITRTFHVFKGPHTELRWHPHLPAEIACHPVTSPNWALYQTFWDVEPSWQHHIAALDRSAAWAQVVEALAAGTCVGYSVVFPKTGAIAHLAVDSGWRGKGVGQALLRQMVAVSESPVVSMINVDANGKSLVQFLHQRALPETLGQYEMIWDLEADV